LRQFGREHPLAHHGLADPALQLTKRRLSGEDAAARRREFTRRSCAAALLRAPSLRPLLREEIPAQVRYTS
jgi:hypothetical protein